MLNTSAPRNTLDLRSETWQERNRLPLLKGLEVARRRSGTIAAVSAIGFAVGLLYLFIAPSHYTAVAQLVTDTRRTHSVPAAPEAMVDPSVIESQIEMIRSEKISQIVIHKLDLQNDPEFVQPGLVSRLLVSVGFGEGDQGALQAIHQRQTLDNFQHALKVTQIGRSYVADIRFTSEDPDKAARIANTIADSYIDDQLEAVTSSATRARSWIAQRLDELRRQADDATKAVDTFKADNNITNASDEERDGSVQTSLRALEAAAASFRRSYETFQNLNQYAQTAQEQSLPATEARVLSQALAPVVRSSPKTGVVLLLSLLTGCGLGLALAYGREHFDRAVHASQQLEDELGIRALGYLPLLSRRKVIADWRRRIAKSRFFGFLGSGRGRIVPLFKHDRTPQAWETLFNVRLAIDAHNEPSNGRVIGVTSAKSEEGKTTVALNLADSVAENDKRVLLVDADLRKRSLTKLLDANCEKGLPEALARTLELSELKCRHFGFHLLPQPQGHGEKCPPEILSSKDMAELLAQARKSFDYVVVDLPAALGHVDVATIEGSIDAFVLVAEWQRTTIDDVDRVISASSILSERLIGVIINKVAGYGTRAPRTG